MVIYNIHYLYNLYYNEIKETTWYYVIDNYNILRNNRVMKLLITLN